MLNQYYELLKYTQIIINHLLVGFSYEILNLQSQVQHKYIPSYLLQDKYFLKLIYAFN